MLFHRILQIYFTQKGYCHELEVLKCQMTDLTLLASTLLKTKTRHEPSGIKGYMLMLPATLIHSLQSVNNSPYCICYHLPAVSQTTLSL